MSIGWLAVIGCLLLYDYKNVFLYPQINRSAVLVEADGSCQSGPQHVWKEEGRIAYSNSRSDCMLRIAAKNLKWKQIANIPRSAGLLLLPCLTLFLLGWVCLVLNGRIRK